MIGNADITKAIVALWHASGLDTEFNQYWAAGLRNQLPVLHDQEAVGDQPFPYCVFSIPQNSVGQRMAGAQNENGIREIRNVPLSFRVYTASNNGEVDPKERAATLIDAVMAVFGGHPTTANRVDGLALDHGNILLSQYQIDYAVMEDQENYQWLVQYNLVADVPVA